MHQRRDQKHRQDLSRSAAKHQTQRGHAGHLGQKNDPVGVVLNLICFGQKGFQLARRGLFRSHGKGKSVELLKALQMDPCRGDGELLHRSPILLVAGAERNKLAEHEYAHVLEPIGMAHALDGELRPLQVCAADHHIPAKRNAEAQDLIQPLLALYICIIGFCHIKRIPPYLSTYGAYRGPSKSILYHSFSKMQAFFAKNRRNWGCKPGINRVQCAR